MQANYFLLNQKKLGITFHAGKLVYPEQKE
jgi:hypothetical protein